MGKASSWWMFQTIRLLHQRVDHQQMLQLVHLALGHLQLVQQPLIHLQFLLHHQHQRMLKAILAMEEIDLVVPERVFQV